MNHTQTIMFLIVIVVAGLLSLAVAAGTIALARWDSRTVPAAITRGFVAFGGTLTLIGGLIGLVLTAFK
ncbi:hypothetical protein [Streptomyces sp. NBC_01296]|uniref:hypothetical protein n=1 Tax=Streptomyces sp. NBC_01296 TaxID=2903816 RepID=UPI002E0E55AE|nr:hypothetical protein OG299_00565 [Streptomyces sp. NBC_01296]